LLEAALIGIVGALSGSILGYFGAMRTKSSDLMRKSRLSEDARKAHADIVDMKTSTIKQLQGKLSRMHQVDVSNVDVQGEGSFGELLSGIMEVIPDGWKPIVKPAVEAGVEKWNNDPAFKDKVTKAVNRFVEKKGANGIVKPEEEGL